MTTEEKDLVAAYIKATAELLTARTVPDTFRAQQVYHEALDRVMELLMEGLEE
jgi:hypothetical protein